MAKLLWTKPTKEFYETGVDHCVFYSRDVNGNYINGILWNGISEIVEKPTDAKPEPIYANNNKYLNLTMSSFFAATIEAYNFPKEFAYIFGKQDPTSGLRIGQQDHKTFGFTFRTLISKDVFGNDYNYKLHLVYGAIASLAESKSNPYRTINSEAKVDSFSWNISTTTVNTKRFNSTACITIEASKVEKNSLTKIEDILYGTYSTPRMPSYEDVIKIFLVGDLGWIVGTSLVGTGRIN